MLLGFALATPELIVLLVMGMACAGLIGGLVVLLLVLNRRKKDAAVSSITFDCPHCRGSITSAPGQIGQAFPCPHCLAPVECPSGLAPSGPSAGLIVALVSIPMIFLLGCPLMFVIALAAISVLGQKASGTFTTVGNTIGGS